LFLAMLPEAAPASVAELFAAMNLVAPGRATPHDSGDVHRTASPRRWNIREIEMARFNPAPPDKYADDIKVAARGARHPYDLEVGLEDTFPASDAVSATQPAQTSYDMPKGLQD
jgi:hypothetical protein